METRLPFPALPGRLSLEQGLCRAGAALMPPSHTHHMGGGRVRPSPCLGQSCVTQRHWAPTSPTLKAASTRPQLGRGLAFPICLSPPESCPRPVCCLYRNGNNNFCKALLTWLQVRPGATGMETLPLRVWGSGGGEGSQSCGTASSGGASPPHPSLLGQTLSGLPGGRLGQAFC